MQAKWEKIEKNVGVLEVEIDEAKVAEALDKAFKKVVQKVNVPGFRKGKVPRGIFESRFGIESRIKTRSTFCCPAHTAKPSNRRASCR